MLEKKYLKIGFLLIFTGLLFFTIEIQKVSANENDYNVNAEEEYVDNEYVENLDGIIIDGESSQE
ncbi:TPA_asm: hypothetical protein GGB65_06725 [Listeria monocytogenes]|nr:hypothetical protein [Listeria monocytogenes]